jgi:uncharacterized protein
MSEPTRKGDWAQTYTGNKFWPMDPRPEDVNIKDIAHSLALSCRFNGHCNLFYSVAQHSVFVSELVKPPQALAALLHDSPEAYLGDIIPPVKLFLPNIEKVERKLEEVIFQRFGIEHYDNKEIKHADKIALYTEMRDLMSNPPETWREFEDYKTQLPKNKIIALNSEESEKLFLKRYQKLSAIR